MNLFHLNSPLIDFTLTLNMFYLFYRSPKKWYNVSWSPDYFKDKHRKIQLSDYYLVDENY